MTVDPSLLTNLFHIGPDAQTTVSLLEKVVRPVLVYLFLVIGLRLAGKRELAQLNAFDLVVLLTISNTVQNAIIGSDNSVLGGIVGATTLLVFNYVVVRFVFAEGGEGQAEMPRQPRLVRVGEVSGKLDAVLNYLLVQQEREYYLRSKAANAMIYPAIILTALLAMVTLMLLFVIRYRRREGVEALAPVHHQSAGRWSPEWQPWPGETVTIAVSRPAAS